MTFVGLAIAAVALWFSTVPWFGLGPPGFEYSVILNDMLLGTWKTKNVIPVAKDKPFRWMCLLYNDPSCDRLEIDNVPVKNTNVGNHGNTEDEGSYISTWKESLPDIYSWVNCPRIQAWAYSVMSFAPSLYSCVFKGGMCPKIFSLTYDLTIMKTLYDWWIELHASLWHLYKCLLYCCYSVAVYCLLPVLCVLVCVSGLLYLINRARTGPLEPATPSVVDMATSSQYDWIPNVQYDPGLDVHDLRTDDTELQPAWLDHLRQREVTDTPGFVMLTSSKDELTQTDDLNNEKAEMSNDSKAASLDQYSMKANSDTAFEDIASATSMNSSISDMKGFSSPSADSGVVMQGHKRVEDILNTYSKNQNTLSYSRNTSSYDVTTGSSSMFGSFSDDSVSKMTDYTVSTDANSSSDWQAAYYHADCPYCEGGSRTPVPFDDPVDCPGPSQHHSDMPSDQSDLKDRSRSNSIKRSNLISRSWSEARGLVEDSFFRRSPELPRAKSCLGEDNPGSTNDIFNRYDVCSCVSAVSSEGRTETPFVQSLGNASSTVNLHNYSETIVVNTTYMDWLPALMRAVGVPSMFRRSRNYNQSILQWNERHPFELAQALEDHTISCTKILVDSPPMSLDKLHSILRHYGDPTVFELIAAWMVVNAIDSVWPYLPVSTNRRLHMSIFDQTLSAIG